jgi:hypothetical protein
MSPNEVMRTAICEMISFINGYNNRKESQMNQTRLIAYEIARVPLSFFGKTDEMPPMEEWMPLWFDPTPEERKLSAEKEKKVKGMIAEKDIEHYRKLGINI